MPRPARTSSLKPALKWSHSPCVERDKEDVIMGARKMIFPIALVILWVLMAAMAMADFARFSETTHQVRHSARMVQGRTAVRPTRG
jgi:hypothetical protein